MHHNHITITGGKGFQAKTGFREGLQKTIAWYEANHAS
jgi:dTDP-D-glucose 4,6-dehydratase